MGRRPTQVAGVVAILLASATACSDDGDGDGPTPSPTVTSASASPTGSGSATSPPASPSTTSSPSAPSPSATTAASLRSIPVYYVAESRRSFALYREFRTVPDTGGPVASAVSAMTRLAPLDPDYASPWRPARRTSVTQRGGAITVDLSADAFSNGNVGSELAEVAVQQLVHTATAAASQSGTPATTVTITKDGRAADAWGAVRIGSPMRRAPMAEIQAHAWVTSPQEGEVRRAGTVAFTGYGTSFEANFPWVVRTSAGKEVARGFVMGGPGSGGFGAMSFSARLGPGRYTVTLSTDDASGGAEGNGPATDDKTFTVR